MHNRLLVCRVAPKDAPKIVSHKNVTTCIWQAGAFNTNHHRQFTSETSTGGLLEKDMHGRWVLSVQEIGGVHLISILILTISESLFAAFHCRRNCVADFGLIDSTHALKQSFANVTHIEMTNKLS